jgi:hypothetical protein
LRFLNKSTAKRALISSLEDKINNIKDLKSRVQKVWFLQKVINACQGAKESIAYPKAERKKTDDIIIEKSVKELRIFEIKY